MSALTPLLFIFVLLKSHVTSDPIDIVRLDREAGLYEPCPIPDTARLCETGCTNWYRTCRDDCNDEACIAECNRDGLICLDDCPCHDGCPNGCDGCASWVCDIIMPTNATMLVINTPESLITSPYLIDLYGEMHDPQNFVFDEGTGSYFSCSVVLNGQMLILGGQMFESMQSQISTVESSFSSCRLHLLGTLPVPFQGGACNTFQFGDTEEALLCFRSGGFQECHRFDGSQVTQAASANNPHWMTTLGNYKNTAIAVGDGYTYPPGGEIQVEQFDLALWHGLDPFPFFRGCQYSHYSMVTFEDELYIFGGECIGQVINEGTVNLAAKFNGIEWTNAGQLITPRVGHRSIAAGNQIIHVGGCTDNDCSVPFEGWIAKDGEFTTYQSDAVLHYFANYPETFLVDNDFCWV